MPFDGEKYQYFIFHLRERWFAISLAFLTSFSANRWCGSRPSASSKQTASRKMGDVHIILTVKKILSSDLLKMSD
ncbi:hypothetical protein YDYSG_59160 [Paenibacillus tyrfis]|nr:hypothetical protein YDYSG_59160 [Paenibacillus tyrfis]